MYIENKLEMADNKNNIKEELQIPEGISVKVDSGIVTVNGSKGEIKRDIRYKKIRIAINNNLICFSAKEDNKKIWKMIGTYRAHIKNMFRGVKEEHKYILKICSGHFPMNVSVSKNEFIVKNLLGEKIPRVLKIRGNVSIRVDGEFVTVESADKEIAGQCAADIEQLTKRSGYDSRIFQDGCYIISKDGKDVR